MNFILQHSWQAGNYGYSSTETGLNQKNKDVEDIFSGGMLTKI
jgi:hypothetical protein